VRKLADGGDHCDRVEKRTGERPLQLDATLVACVVAIPAVHLHFRHHSPLKLAEDDAHIVREIRRRRLRSLAALASVQSSDFGDFFVFEPADSILQRHHEGV